MAFFGYFSDRLKYTIIKPLFKNGDRSSLENYRQISLWIAFAKLFETAVFCRVSQHFQVHNILSQNNMDLKKDYPQVMLSTSLQVVFFKHGTINGTLEEFFCDLSKTFYTVHHKVLLQNLKFYSTQGKLVGWFELYWCGRKQRVVLNSLIIHKTILRVER